MTAPDRIWAWHHKDAMLDNRQWADNPYARYHLPATEYVRADLARAPLAEALAVQEVAALVKAAKVGLMDLEAWLAVAGIDDAHNTDMTHYAVQELTAAIRAIGEPRNG